MTRPAADIVEDAIVDEATGRISRPQAIARIRAVLQLTERGAEDLFTHPVAPHVRYEAALPGRES